MSETPAPPAAGNRPKLLLVDGHGYAYRAFYAIRRLSAPTGEPTNAIYGFVKMLLKMEQLIQPTHRLVVWDAGLAEDRLAALPDYKANRAPTPDDLEKQFPEIESWLAAYGWASFSQPGTEADDWIGTLARRAEAAGWYTVIATSDKDFMQLVSPDIAILNPNDKTEKLWSVEDVVAKTGVEPRQIVDWLSLIGDAVDNIPGVAGVGLKTATDLLKRFGSVESILAHRGELKSAAQKASLDASVEQLARNQLMIRLRDRLSGGPSLESLAPAAADVPRLREQYRRWNFRSLLADLGEDTPAPEPDLFGG